jgi:hypothetical protein
VFALFIIKGYIVRVGGSMKKPRKLTDFRENTGKVLIDLGKLVFGSMFLGGVLRGEVPPAIMVTGGFIVTILFCGVGLWAITKEKKKEKI